MNKNVKEWIILLYMIHCWYKAKMFWTEMCWAFSADGWNKSKDESVVSQRNFEILSFNVFW